MIMCKCDLVIGQRLIVLHQLASERQPLQIWVNSCLVLDQYLQRAMDMLQLTATDCRLDHLDFASIECFPDLVQDRLSGPHAAPAYQ